MPTTLILHALCNSPLLIKHLPEASSFDREPLSPAEVSSPLNLDQKLGHLYEDALALLIQSSHRYELLERNLQLQSSIHKTQGEIDFLLRDHASGRLIHLELAVKFYLAVQSPDGLLLPGPDARDNFFKKLHRLRSHQLILTKKYRDHLPAKYRNESIAPQHLILGAVFDHITSGHPAEAEFLSHGARRGHWLRQCELITHFPNRHIQTIPKHLWPVETSQLPSHLLHPFSNDSPLDRCLLLKIQDHPHPIFLTPDNYPQSS
ncbi:DUF1853 family protein [Sulfuriroseicoccus oceanibius]|uniref:DUF1853 family protein n=1 Tax=Sulfuriroseicoccus oceanibius TaxID=2707525 RepID=A0A6B3L2P5_9BACT|nr:DUF1853 family protein [Sulfuriroseicoccus oceanibius]QQL46123.1 DUF1853 family protein [Sulfuriroseicoccus oceanibius]